MAIATAGTSFADMLLRDTRRQLRSLVQLETTTLAQLQRKRTSTTGGKQFEFPLHTSRSEAVGVRAENIDIPDPQSQGYTLGYDTVNPMYGVIEISLDLMELSRSNKYAFANALKEEMTRMVSNVGAEMNRIIHGDNTGKLCLVDGAVSGAASVTVDGGLYGSTGSAVDHTRPIRANMELDFWNSTTLEAEKIRVAAVSSATVFTTDQNVTVTDNDVIVHHAARNASGTSREMEGLQSIVKTSGTLHNVDPTTYAAWVADEQTSVGSPTELSIIAALDAIDKASGVRGSSQVALMTPGCRRAVYKELQGYRRINSATLNGGFEALSVNGLPLMATDYDVPYGVIYILNPPDLQIFDMGDWDWLQQDGSILHRTDRATFKATLYRFWQLVTKYRPAHGKLTGVTEA